MADNHFDLVIVWDNLGGAVRVNAGGKATVTDPATGELVSVVQDGQTVTVVTADVNGRVSFVAQQGIVKLVAGGLAMIAVSSEQATAGAANAAAAQAAQVATEAARDDVVTGLNARALKVDVDVRDYGAVGDGVTDDGPAIRAALAAAAGKRLSFPRGTFRLVANGSLQLLANTTMQGVPGETVINLEAATPGAYTEFARNAGDNVRLQGLTVNRAADFPAVLLPVQNWSGMTVLDCVFNGNRDVYSNYCMGLQIGAQNGGTFDGLQVERTTFTKLSYGLFQAGESTGVARNLSFRACTFTANTADDLEFNAPVSDNFNVSVVDCAFSANTATGSTSGFAVGLAHITGVVIRGCTFTDYNNEAIHAEDYCDGILIEGCRFERCAMIRAAYIRVISACRHVRIIGNIFDSTANTNFVPVIQATAGGTGTTVGGRTIFDPFRLTIKDNHFRAGTCSGIYLSNASNSVVSGNGIFGSGTVSSGVYNNANTGYGVELWAGYGIAVTGNTIMGFGQALARHTTNVSTGGNGLTVTGNTVQQCDYGLAVVNPGTAVISGNIAQECIHPMLVGQGQGTSRPVVIAGNMANGCKYRMEVGGALVVVASSAVSVGATSVPVKSVGLNLPSGTVVTFSGGGTLTLSSAVLAGATSLPGTVSGAAIASGEAAVVTGLAHSTVSADNHATLTGNSDSVAGTY